MEEKWLFVDIFHSNQYKKVESLSRRLRKCNDSLLIKNNTDPLLIMSFLKNLMIQNDPENPSLGFLLRMLRFSGIWHPELRSMKSRLKLLFFYITLTFFSLQYVKVALNFNTGTIKLLLQNTPFHLGIVKCLFFQKDHKSWGELVQTISSVERKQSNSNEEQQKTIKYYLSQSRRVTCFFFAVAVVADITIYTEPYLRNQTDIGVYNYIFSTYTPFPRQPPWYYCTMLFQTIFGFVMSFYIVCWDMTTVTIMIYLAGQLRVCGLYCSNVIDVKSRENSQRNIAECHKFHRSLVMAWTKFHKLISPVATVYVVIVSVNLGACIIQMAEFEKDFTAVVATCVYTAALLIQLLVLFWHSNEVTLESERLNYNTFKSNWVNVDLSLQKQILLLSWTTSKRLAFKAGPFNEMSLATFLSLLRGTYSFYMLLKETS